MAQNIENIKKVLDEAEIIGLVIPDAEYDETLIKAASFLSKYYHKILYVSINKPCDSLSAKFRRIKQGKADMDKIYFMDCITMISKDIMPIKNCEYISSPRAMDEIQNALTRVIREHEIDLVLFDSPGYLLMYYEHMDVLKFIHRLMIEIIVSGCKGIFPFPEESAGTLRRSVEMFINKTVTLNPGRLQ